MALAVAASAALPALAQQGAAEEREEELQQDIEGTEDVERAAEDALDLEAFGDGPPVTYQDVLADPDNIELNFRYALTQIREGNVRGAGATLERILLIRPDLATVRVLFAIVLFRLDNLDEAERELRAVRDLEMPDDLRQQIDRYLEQIAQRRKTTKFVLAVNLATQYDWNRNASPTSKERFAFGLPTRATGGSLRQDDLSLNGLAQISFEHDLGAQKRHMMVGGLVYYQGEQVQQDDLDLHAVSADWGFSLDFAPNTFTPRLLYENVLLSRQKYLDSRGFSLDWNRDVSNTFKVFGTGKVKYQSYNNITGNTTATQRSGRVLDFQLGFSQVLDPTQRIRASFRRARTIAARGFNSFDRDEISATHTWLFEDGDFLLSSLTLTRDRYDRNDPSIATDTRSDKAGRLRVTYGLPLRAIDDEVPALLQDLTLTVSAEAYRQLSNITNFSYKNYRFSVGVNRRWEF
ncbi:MAG: DUF560 domain-containing protein [Alphaproteobacteria bacterium]|nr:DUF560 domain-containing protein [Alphaproteobacteria bacterium]